MNKTLYMRHSPPRRQARPSLNLAALDATLAFASGCLSTMLPLWRAGYGEAAAIRIAYSADTASAAIMEVADNPAMLLIPGAMAPPPTSLLFWGSLAASLMIAAIAAFPVNKYLISKCQGHALAHAHHCGG